MRNGFYAKIAIDNIKRNSKTYTPYIITCIATAAMLYIIKSLSLNAGLDDMSGGSVLREILKLGNYITQIFAFIFLFYTNNFLIKQRKKEFGLFNVLGMGKRHIAKVLLFESVYTSVIALAAGIGAGILLDKLMFLVLTKIVGGNVQFGFYISTYSLIVTCLFMIFTFIMLYLNALRQIHLANPVELLHGSDMGEKEPKAKWLMAVIGIVLVGIGYYFSLTTKQPLEALLAFFTAVVCVMIGTYFLFTAGSIALLKILKMNKRYYYQINHFTSVSSMMYRMKQNAVGLANICILSTMILVMVSSTSCLLVGVDDTIHTHYPYDYSISSKDSSMPDKVDAYLYEQQIEVSTMESYASLTFEVMREGNHFYIPYPFIIDDISKVYGVEVMDLENYHHLTGDDIELQNHEILLYSNDNTVRCDMLTLMDFELSVKENLKSFPITGTEAISCIYVIVKDKAIVQSLYEAQNQISENSKVAHQIGYHFSFDIKSGEESEIYQKLDHFLSENTEDYHLETRFGKREDFLNMHGGLFFLGVFLGTLFLMQTVLIIYYKQISEGFDDKKRFEIMQNVGMSRDEVKKSIHSQIITVFFMPLLTAGVHTGFAFPIICKMLVVFDMRNTVLFAVCLLVCFVVFSLIYTLIYSFTAKTYYKIVSK